MKMSNFLSMTLRDGRKFAWREYGAKNGLPLVFLHGNLNSRMFAPAWVDTDSVTESAGVRLIAVDRAGYGDSSPHPGRTYGACADDVTQLLDHLSIERAAILGYSSGGPNALSCVAHQPTRFSVCGLLSSDGPYAQMGGDIIPTLFKVPEVTEEFSRERAVTAYRELKQAYEGMKNEARREIALADLDHAVKQGHDAGPAQDALLETGNWDFNVADIDTSSVPVLIWHGEADTDVPVSVGKYLAEYIAGSEAFFVEGESHSMIRRKWGHVLSTLKQRVDDRSL